MEKNKTSINKIIALKDLQKEDVEKLKQYNVTFKRLKTKAGNTYSRVYLDLGHIMLSNIEIRYNGNPLSEDRINAILVSTNNFMLDAMGNPIDTITRKAPVRFIKGTDENDPTRHFYSLEIIFKRHLYNIHFLSSDQMRIINALIEKKAIDIKFTDYTYNKVELNEFDESSKSMDF